MYTYQRSYCGPIQAVIFDWAGTILDYGCMAPASAFLETFKSEGLDISMAEARAPMGLKKDDHIRQMLSEPAIKERWFQTFNRYPDESDALRLFKNFVPAQLACLSSYSKLIPGTLEVMEGLRAQNIKIGTTSGYLTEMMRINMSEAEGQGFVADSNVCASDVQQARPYPSMCLINALNLQVSNLAACVKVDDTPVGIEEGLNAQMWTIGVAMSGNEVGLSHEDWSQLDVKMQSTHRTRAYQSLERSGAHYVIDTVAQLSDCINDIERRLRSGERP